MKHPDLSICTISIAGIIGVLSPFLFCYFGKVATESFEDMGDCLYECNWQVLPVHFQKHLILIIANMQRPIYFHGFGMVYLNLGTFTKVIWFISQSNILTNDFSFVYGVDEYDIFLLYDVQNCQPRTINQDSLQIHLFDK